MAVLRRSREEWRRHVEAWMRSGLSGVDYARRHGLNANTFAWWRSELRRERVVSTGLTLVPVRTMPAGSNEPIEVALPDGVVVRVTDHSDLARVRQLVRALVVTC